MPSTIKPNHEPQDRVQALLDKRGRSTSYEAFCDVMNDMAQYAAVMSWDFIEEAQTSAFVASRGRPL